MVLPVVGEDHGPTSPPLQGLQCTHGTPSSVGALKERMHRWKNTGASRMVKNVVNRGFKIPWDSKPPLAKSPIPFAPPRNPIKFQALDKEVCELLEKKAVTVVDPVTPGFYSTLFTVPKKNGKLRPVLDLSPLNKHVRKIKFRMETVQSIRSAIRVGDWATSIDLTDAYFHVLIHEKDRKFLRFCWKNQVFQFRALPFGLTSAPYIFTEVVIAMVKLLREQGHRLKTYLDDWLNLHRSERGCLVSTDQVLQTTKDLGFQVNNQKSEFQPKQVFKYLGVVFDTIRFVVYPPEDRVLEFQRLILSTCNQDFISLRRLLEILGVMESLAPFIPTGRTFKRPLQRWSVVNFPDQSLYDHLCPVDEDMKQSMRPWLDKDWLMSGVPIRRLKEAIFLYSDASNTGWGAHCQELETSGFWTKGEMEFHINFKELEAIFRALRRFKDRLRGSWVIVCADNTTALAYLAKQGGTKSRTLSLRAEEVVLWCHRNDIQIQTRFIPGKVNTLADSLSRKGQIVTTEWTIEAQFLIPLWEMWGRPHLDLFASRHNNRLPIFVSLNEDPLAFKRDAMSFSWNSLDVYAFPPFAMIPQILEKWSIEKPRMILITPGWTSKSWYPELLDLAKEGPILLNLPNRALFQPVSRICHTNTGSLNLTAWLLSV